MVLFSLGVSGSSRWGEFTRCSSRDRCARHPVVSLNCIRGTGENPRWLTRPFSDRDEICAELALIRLTGGIPPPRHAPQGSERTLIGCAPRRCPWLEVVEQPAA